MIYFISGVICTIFLYHIFRRVFRISINHNEEKIKAEFRDNVNKLIIDFNRVSNTNINMLEDKIEDLRKTIELADEKIIKLNLLMNDLQIMTNKLEKVLDNKVHTKTSLEPLSQNGGNGGKYDKVYELASCGSSIEDIARSVDMSKSEVKLVLGLRRKNKRIDEYDCSLSRIL